MLSTKKESLGSVTPEQWEWRPESGSGKRGYGTPYFPGSHSASFDFENYIRRLTSARINYILKRNLSDIPEYCLVHVCALDGESLDHGSSLLLIACRCENFFRVDEKDG